MTKTVSALCGFLLMSAAAAQAIDLPASAQIPSSPVQAAQYDGPMDGGPGPGMPPGGGMPGAGAGYGMGPGYGRPGAGADNRQRGWGDSSTHHYVSYHGFRIDIAGVEGVMDPANTERAVEHQIDIVDRAGVSPSMLALFRSFPIRVSASFTGMSHYSGGREVVIGGASTSDNRPVLLHEYMHVLHLNRLPEGYRNPDIRRFYEEAQQRGLWNASSYMMTNHLEFFAMTASCYLNGTVAREPYTREEIRQKMPDYYAYLQHLFGRGGFAEGTDGPHVAGTLH